MRDRMSLQDAAVPSPRTDEQDTGKNNGAGRDESYTRSIEASVRPRGGSTLGDRRRLRDRVRKSLKLTGGTDSADQE